jgi:hypothetical protein
VTKKEYNKIFELVDELVRYYPIPYGDSYDKAVRTFRNYMNYLLNKKKKS